VPGAAKVEEEEEAEGASFCAGTVPCTAAEEESFNACFERLLCLWIPKGICLMNNIVAGAHDRVFSTKYGVWCKYPLHSQRADCLLGGACLFEMRAATDKTKAKALEPLKQMHLRAG
jgi:hypothetical protein